MTWSPTLMFPEALTVRSVSMTPPDGGGSGGGPAGRLRLSSPLDRPWRHPADV